MKHGRTPIPQPKRSAPARQQTGAAAQNHAAKLAAALALHQQGRLDQAAMMYQEILQSQPQHFEALQLLATIALQQKSPEAAVALFDQALAINPRHPSALHNYGVALRDLKRFDEALESYDRALKIQPNYAEALNSRGNVLQDLRRFEEALESYDRALKIQPDYAEALSNRGNVLQDLRRFEEALESYGRALQIRPDYAQALSNRGNTLRILKRFEEALTSYDRSLQLRPDYVEALINRGNTLRILKRPAQALESYDRALKIQPDFVEALSNRGLVLQDMKRLEEALNSYGRALRIRPDYAEAHWNEGLCRLLMGDFSGGWSKYEWRWKKEPGNSSVRNFTQPLWLGKEKLEGKTILLHAEQGLGDTIQFCRYATQVAALGARVILEVQPPLKTLLKELEGVSMVLGKGERLPDFDFHCPLMSLPLAFHTDVGAITGSSYLHSDPEKLKEWQIRLGKTSRKRVGLVWTGNTVHTNDHNRSLAMEDIKALVTDKADFYCLQKEWRLAEPPALVSASGIEVLGDSLEDFSDTAAVVALMDLVITVDTSVAHLAGAMGKEVWMLLPFSPDWRWLLERSDSPWYSSARLFRQPALGDWASVLKQVQAELGSRLAASEGEPLRPAAPLRWQPGAATQNHAAKLATALALHQQGRLDQAAALYQEILQLQPQHFEALQLLGTVALQQKSPAIAVVLLDQALAINPRLPSALHNRGNAMRDLKRPAEALASYDGALSIKPDYVEALSGRGNALHDLARYEEALASFDQALKLKPDHAEAFNNRGNTLQDLKRPGEALKSFERALQIRPDYAEAHWNEGLCRLLMGDFTGGWPKYEWRWKREPGSSSLRNFTQPLWLGKEKLAGKTILLHAEQGLGDTIQFCRYARQVAALGARVVLEVQPPLKTLLRDLEGASLVLGQGERLPDFDFHCPLMSLPLAFQVNMGSITGSGYLHSDPKKFAEWQTRLGNVRQKKVGLVWSGSAGHPHDQSRSLALEGIKTLVTAQESYYCLQKEWRPAEPPALISASGIEILGDALKDFSDTAAVVALMDVVITVDTSVAHLAGAMGKDVWVLLPFSPDWRWLLDRNDSPWYGSARLFRQSALGDWASVLRQVQAELKVRLQ